MDNSHFFRSSNRSIYLFRDIGFLSLSSKCICLKAFLTIIKCINVISNDTLFIYILLTEKLPYG